MSTKTISISEYLNVLIFVCVCVLIDIKQEVTEKWY